MKAIRRILYATDFSKSSARALDQAIGLAQQNQAELLALHVIVAVPYMAGEELSSADIYAKMEEVTERQAKAGMTKLMQRLQKAKVKAQSLLLKGSAHDQIVKAAKSQKGRLIVIGTHGRTGVVETVYGQRRRQSYFVGDLPAGHGARKIKIRLWPIAILCKNLFKISIASPSTKPPRLKLSKAPNLYSPNLCGKRIASSHVSEERGATAYGRYMLHRAPRFNISSVVWGPGDSAKAHNHDTWGMVGVIENEIQETRFRRKDDGANAQFADLEVTAVLKNSSRNGFLFGRAG